MIIKYANLLNRTPSALNMKIGNIGRLDPDLKRQGISGLVHGAKMEEEVWNEFYGNPELLAFESEKIIARLTNQSIEMCTSIRTDDLPQGKEREIIIKQRINQSFFRSRSECSMYGCNRMTSKSEQLLLPSDHDRVSE